MLKKTKDPLQSAHIAHNIHHKNIALKMIIFNQNKKSRQGTKTCSRDLNY